MICPAGGAATVFATSRSVWSFPSEKSINASARYRLTEMAEHTLDVQYYIWQDDMSGRLLFSALLAAAKRGVRVRLFAGRQQYAPDLTTFYACLTAIPH